MSVNSSGHFRISKNKSCQSYSEFMIKKMDDGCPSFIFFLYTKFDVWISAMLACMNNNKHIEFTDQHVLSIISNKNKPFSNSAGDFHTQRPTGLMQE